MHFFSKLVISIYFISLIFSNNFYGCHLEDDNKGIETYKNCLFNKDYQKEFCNKDLYTQPKLDHTKDTVTCGRIYSYGNEQRIIICKSCYTDTSYDSNKCSSDRNAYITKFHTRFEGVSKDFPQFLFKFGGSDLEEMLLKEREMFKKGFRVIYHVCNRGNWHEERYLDRNQISYVSPFFLYQLFGVLNAIKSNICVDSPNFVSCIPRFDKDAFDKVPNRDSLIEVIKTRHDHDCNKDARNVSIVGIAAIGGCYHNESGGIIFSRYIGEQSLNAIPDPREIILNALISSGITIPVNKIEDVIDDLLKLSESFHVVKSALLQIFLNEDSFLSHVCYARNGGADIQPIDRRSIQDGKHLKSGIQLNVYLPTNLVTDQEKCKIYSYTRCGSQNTPIFQKHLVQFRKKVKDIISKNKQ